MRRFVVLLGGVMVCLAACTEEAAPGDAYRRVDIEIGHRSEAILAVDVDGDGQVDLVAAGRASSWSWRCLAASRK